MESFRSLWWKGKDPHIEGGVLKAGPGPQYCPLEVPNLPNALAKVRDAEAAVRFAGTYGRLGYDWILPKGQLDRRVGGDPLDWFLTQADTVRCALALVEALGREDENVAGAILKAQSVQTPAGFLIAKGPARVVQELFVEPDFGEPPALAAARAMVAGLVNGNTEGVHREISRMQGQLASGFVFPALISAIWWMLGDAAILAQEQDGAAIRLCEECGTPFVVTDRRQRFCPPEFGSKASVCGTRYRMRQHRAKKGAGK